MKTKEQLMDEMLNQAIASNNLKRAEELIKIGAKTTDLRKCVENNLREMAGLLLQQDFPTRTDILHWIVENRYVELIEPALKKNPDGAYQKSYYTNANGNTKWGTPLDCAIENDDMEIAKLLVKHGVNANRTNYHSFYHSFNIVVKIEDGDIKWTEFFIDSGADLERALTTAVGCDERDIIDLLLKKGADIKKSGIWSVVTTKDMGEFLVSLGADVHEKGKGNNSSLHNNNNKDLDLIKFLIDSGVDVNAKNDVGCSPLHYENRVEVVELLISAGADVKAKENGGKSPLHCTNSVEVVELLISAGADVNDKNNGGFTPLFSHTLPNSNSKKIIKLLIKKGADVNAKANDGNTLLHLLAHHSSANSLIELLIKHGADVNAKDNDGMTPLHVSALYEIFSNSRIFIDAGANLFTLDRNGKTPEERTRWRANSRKINNYMKNILSNLSPEEVERRKEKALEEYNIMMGNVKKEEEEKKKTEEELMEEIEKMISALYEDEE